MMLDTEAAVMANLDFLSNTDVDMDDDEDMNDDVDIEPSDDIEDDVKVGKQKGEWKCKFMCYIQDVSEFLNLHSLYINISANF